MSASKVVKYMVNSTYGGNEDNVPVALFEKVQQYARWVEQRLVDARVHYVNYGTYDEVIDNGLEFPEKEPPSSSTRRLTSDGYTFVYNENLELSDYLSASKTYVPGCVDDEYLWPLHKIANKTANAVYYGNSREFKQLIATYGKGAIDGRILAAANTSPFLFRRDREAIREIVRSVDRDGQWVLFSCVPSRLGSVEWEHDRRDGAWYARLSPPS